MAAEELASHAERLLAAPSVPVEKARKGWITHDGLRQPALVRSVGASTHGPLSIRLAGRDGAWLDGELVTRPRGARPRELMEGLDADLVTLRARREQQWIERDGARWDPLASRGDLSGAGAAPAVRRAS